MNQCVEYKPFYLTCGSKACRDGGIADKEINKSGFDEAKEMEVVFGDSSIIDSWMQLVRKVSWIFPGLETEENMDEHKQTVLKFMNKKQALCVRNKEAVVGVLLFSRSRNMICCLAVDPEHRKQGLASILLRKALDELDKSKEITVSTFRENDEKGIAPRALYKKYGFQEGEMTEEFGYPNQVLVLYPYMNFERLETARLVLRKAEGRDLDAIWKNVWRDAALAGTMLWTPTPAREAARERLARTVAYQADNYGYFVCDRETDEPIGFAGVRETEPGTFEETGICIARAWQGRGLGKETLCALVGLVFDGLGGRRFLYSCFHDNTVSAALCRACGFRYLRSEDKVRERDGMPYVCDIFERAV